MKAADIKIGEQYVLIAGDPTLDQNNGNCKVIELNVEENRAVVQMVDVYGKPINGEPRSVSTHCLYKWTYLEQIINFYWEPGY